MADTAAFFAKKKKGGKKKSFKSFNANKIDASTISSTVHVDAPAISSGPTKALDLPVNNYAANGLGKTPNATESLLPNSAAGALGEQKDDEGWVDQVTQNVSNNVIQNKATVAELLDMNALEERRREQDDVVERMRVEETKAALAAARQGMEKEAQRLKDEQEKNMKETAPNTNNESASASNGGKWVPVHKRVGASPALGNSRLMMNKARGRSSLPDTKDAMDFPDLAAANAAIEAQKKQEKERQEKERQRAAAKSSGIKPWGGSRSTISAGPGETRKKIQVLPPSSSKAVSSSTQPAKPTPPPEPSKPTSIPKEEVTTKTESIPTPASSSTPAAAAPKPAAPATTIKAPVVKKKKKKKKDLSTFNAA